MDRTPSLSRSSVGGHELAAGPKPLTYRELASGALYNRAQPHRHERRSAAAVSDEQLHHMESHYSTADVSAGHLFNPTSSLHEVDPPTWPAHGMENVPPGRSPFRTYRLERPPSPPLAKKPITVYQGKRPSHHTVASGALFNPYVQTRLPEDLQPADGPEVLQRSTTGNSSRLYAPTPQAPVRIPVVRGPSEASRSLKGDKPYTFPVGDPHSSAHWGNGGYSHQPSLRSQRTQRTERSSIEGGLGVVAPVLAPVGNVPSRARTISDDTIYYHPSREGSVRMVPAPGTGMYSAPAAAHNFSNAPSRAPTSHRPASVHTARSDSPGTILAHPTPWMQHEATGAGNLADSVHPSRSPSAGSFVQHSRAASMRGPSSLHQEAGLHLSRTSSNLGAHPSQDPAVIRDSVFHDDFVGHSDNIGQGEAWGTEGQTYQGDAWGSGDAAAEVERSLSSRASMANGHGGQAWGQGQDDAWGSVAERPASQASTIRAGASGSVRSAHPSRAPSLAGSHTSQQQVADPVPAHIPSRAPSAAPSHASRFQAQYDLPPRAPSVAPSLVSRFQEQNAGASPRTPNRVPSITSMRIRSPMLTGGRLSRAPSFKLPPQYEKLPEEDDPALWGPSDGEPLPHPGPENMARAVSPGAGSLSGAQAPDGWDAPALADGVYVPSAHPSRAPSVMGEVPFVPSHAHSVAQDDAASLLGRQHSTTGGATLVPSRAPSAVGVPSRAPSAAPTLTRRGKTNSKLGRGSGRSTPAVPAGSEPENIRISVVQPTE